jgi:DHA1 family inner membrane transport protein
MTTSSMDAALRAPASPAFVIPREVWLLTLCAFAIGTAEFVIAGLLTQISGSLNVSEGKAGYLIIAFALAVVVGGPPLTIFLSRFEKKKVLVLIMAVFTIANLITAMNTDFTVLLVARVLAGLCQGPFYGIGAVVATRIVHDDHAGKAVGQMFGGLTLASVLGVPAGAWIGAHWGWQSTLYIVAAVSLVAVLGLLAMLRPMPGDEAPLSVKRQLLSFRNPQLLASLAFTTLAWTGFMTFYGYIAPVAQFLAGYTKEGTTIVLVIVGAGMLIGNRIGGHSADRNLSSTLVLWPFLMILSLLLIALLVHSHWGFMLAVFVFGIASFANVSPMQMRVMKYGVDAPELAATANISAFNLANSIGGALGGLVIDAPHLGGAYLPYAAIGASVLGLVLIAGLEWKAVRARAA